MSMRIQIDTAVKLAVNHFPLTDDTDMKTRETAVNYNAAGMDLVWNFMTTAGVFTQTAVAPTTAGDYDWTHKGKGHYEIEVPASGGISINNNVAGYGWFSGIATGILPWVSSVYEFVPVAVIREQVLGTLNPRIPFTFVTGTLDDMAASTDITGYADNSLKGRVGVVLTGNRKGEPFVVGKYTSTGGVIEWAPALSGAPANGDLGIILG